MRNRALILLGLVVGCDEGAVYFSGSGTTSSTTGIGGGGEGGSATTTASETVGGGGAAVTTASTTSGSGGAGGCVSDPFPCGDAICGTIHDNCNVPVYCGTCPSGQTCITGGVCCKPKTCTHYPGACEGAIVDNGCGSAMICGDETCGEGDAMTCYGGKCRCAPQNFDQAEVIACVESLPWYCGADTILNRYEAPTGCTPSGVTNPNLPGSPMIWCCK